MALKDVPGQVVPFKQGVYEKVVQFAQQNLRLNIG